MTQPAKHTHHGPAGILEENARAIGQLTGLLDELPADVYRQSFGLRKQHIIGKHVRHIIDHYSALLSASQLPGGHLNYENRNREPVLEIDCRAGQDRLNDILQQLYQRFDSGCRSDLNMLHNSAGQQQVVKTSVERELVFLASHTVHHMAIIGMLAEQAGIEVDAEFGVHPSTLRYLENQVAGSARTA